ERLPSHGPAGVFALLARCFFGRRGNIRHVIKEFVYSVFRFFFRLPSHGKRSLFAVLVHRDFSAGRLDENLHVSSKKKGGPQSTLLKPLVLRSERMPA